MSSFTQIKATGWAMASHFSSMCLDKRQIEMAISVQCCIYCSGLGSVFSRSSYVFIERFQRQRRTVGDQNCRWRSCQWYQNRDSNVRWPVCETIYFRGRDERFEIRLLLSHVNYTAWVFFVPYWGGWQAKCAWKFPILHMCHCKTEDVLYIIFPSTFMPANAHLDWL